MIVAVTKKQNVKSEKTDNKRSQRKRHVRGGERRKPDTPEGGGGGLCYGRAQCMVQKPSCEEKGRPTDADLGGQQKKNK